jgi:hypothetical protein
MFSRSRFFSCTLLLGAIPSLACTNVGSSPASPPCVQACLDGVALTALRDELKLVYNLTLQGKSVGKQDATTSCPLGGSAHVSGTATSDASVGATMVNLTYDFTQCAYSQTDSDPTQTYSVTVTGTMTEVGVLSAESSSTTALTIKSTSVTLDGTVYSPPSQYDEKDCALDLGQSGNELSGTFCGRSAGTSL